VRRLATSAAAALFFVLGAALVVRRVLPSWQARVAVVGHSMEPALLDGDWLLVDPHAYRRVAPTQGELVVARDPRSAARVLVKRVVEIDAAGALKLAGDHPAHAADPRAIGSVPLEAVLGRPWLRYWPLERLGRIG
jgi:nickel-type superoxide dismutase maturation protease